MKKILAFSLSLLLFSCEAETNQTASTDPTTPPSEINKGADTPLAEDLLPNPQKTYVLIAGALEWQDKGLASFSKTHRKDAELEQYFTAWGVPKSNMVALYDAETSLSKLLDGLEKLSNLAEENATFVFYYAGHGMKPQQDIYFANYDVNLDKKEKTAFPLSQLTESLGKSKVKNIILLADCCYSGGLIKVCHDLNKKGKNAVAITSATASNVSTGNWTFTQTLLDGLNGNSIADHNQNGAIELSELRTELFNAMKYRERQMCGFQINGFDENTVLAKSVVQPNNSSVYGNYYWAKKGDNWEPVRVVADYGNSYNCEFYDYSDKIQKSIPSKQLRKIHFVKHSKGAAVEVEWNGKWYAAKVLDTQDDFCYIKYDNDDDSWNEWVLYDRIRTGNEKKVEVLEGNSYYPAVILEEKDDLFYIHYEGYGATWDEWVGKNRMR